MTSLSINLNKIALLRNSRGRHYPDLGTFAARLLSLGADDITLHPRPDQRHARYQDVEDLAAICDEYGKELNVEGYPTPAFLAVVKRVVPAQCTLVTDSPEQLTSDLGWDLRSDRHFLRGVVAQLKDLGINTSLFADPDCASLGLAVDSGVDRIELYTDPYAQSYGSSSAELTLERFSDAARMMQEVRDGGAMPGMT
ncbi:pyridoxine 5'-phosphate synthase [Metapseudomonas furukawaii]|jgi:pyridoxine 5-phosphate synthase|uniref:pyridoxine 5'-phosphate synthase n=1 Tax=Metapseudomonas furukawaii TaxID=1149133 RepID=UPI00404648D3